MRTIFVSHIGAEAALAEIVQTALRRDFLGMLDVFVSSDGTSIALGTRWLNELDQALRDAAMMLVLCSEHSVGRPWINFEAGAGWLKGIPIIPICHTGMRPDALPIPLKMLQAMEAANESAWRNLYRELANVLGSSVPSFDAAALVSAIREFEHDYGLVSVARAAVRAILTVLPKVEPVFRPEPSHRRISGTLFEKQIDDLKPHLEALRQRGLLDFTVGYRGFAVGTQGGGHEYDLSVVLYDSYYQIAGEVIH